MAYKKVIPIPFVDDVLRGISQIMLQENRLTGLLLLFGMLIGHWSYMAAALLASTAGTLTAKLLKYDPLLIRKGIYGFNPALVGITLTFLFDNTIVIWGLVVSIGGILTVLLHHYFIIKKVTAFTFPYIIVTWILFFILEHLVGMDRSPIEQFKIPIVTDKYGDYLAVIGGFGEVIFQENLAASFIIFLAVYISRPISALYGIVASLLATLLSQIVGQSTDMIYTGLFGFNAVLTAIVFSGYQKGDGFWVLVGTLLTIFINVFLVHFNLLEYVGGAFTFPFVAGTWLTLWLKKKYSKFKIKLKYF